MYHAHVTSILNYCNIIWSNTYPTHLDPLIKTQKRIIRLLTHSDYFAHTEPLFRQLKLLNIENIRKYSLAVYFFKNQATILPALQAHHTYETRHRNRPRPARHHHTIYEKSFIYQATVVWNELLDRAQPIIINSKSLDDFKRNLKQYFTQ